MATMLRWTRDRYRQAYAALEGTRAELIDGMITEVEVTHSPRHAMGVHRATAALADIYGIKRVRCQLPLALSDTDEPEPDVAVLAREWVSLDEHPPTAILVVEVADSSLAFDRTVKLARYALAGIQDYWIVNLIADVVEVFTAPEGEGYTHYTVFRRADSLPCPDAGVLPATALLPPSPA
jgi:Uma2 family endonuclease